ncbi:MAG TPA: RNA polymerase sigma factor [Candidatus Binatia bacterium]|nr:RNA polymerase sigma factor [Candidatus Binatia bacterium]
MRQENIDFLVNNRANFVRLAYKRCGNLYDAEDAVQQAYVKLLTYAARLRDENPTALFAFIVRNESINVHRKRHHVEDLAPVLELPAPQPAELPAELSDAIERAVAGLASEFRMVLAGVSEDKPHRQISCETGIPVPTVASRLYRARAAMQQVLAEYVRA